MLLLLLLLLLPTFTMALLLLLLLLSALALTMTTTLVASMYLTPLFVDISDIKEPKLELNPIAIKLRPEFIQIKDPRTKNRYKDPFPQRRYRMLHAICHQKEAAQEAAPRNNPDLFGYQDSILVPITYTIVNSDVFYDTLNLQPAWIPPYADEIDPFERLTHLPSTIIFPFVDSIFVLYNHKSVLQEK